MAERQVCFVRKHEHPNPCEGITLLGGEGWQWTRQRVIQAIKGKTDTFFTFVDLNRAELGIVRGDDGEYLRTHVDGQWNDDLVALDEMQ